MIPPFPLLPNILDNAIPSRRKRKEELRRTPVADKKQVRKIGLEFEILDLGNFFLNEDMREVDKFKGIEIRPDFGKNL